MRLRTHVVASFAMVRVGLAAAVAALIVTTPAAQSGSPAAQDSKVVPTVAVALLEGLLPQAEGWTKGVVHSNQITISSDCAYTYADAVYTKGEMRVRVTVADSGFDSGALTVLVPMVVSLPEGYSGKIPPATTVDRLMFEGSPAAARWDGEKGDADFEVLVGRRFAARGEGTQVTGIDMARELVAKIDLKRLAALK
jgi:invasion protein IalB